MMMTRARALSGISHGPITHLGVGNPGAYVERWIGRTRPATVL